MSPNKIEVNIKIELSEDGVNFDVNVEDGKEITYLNLLGCIDVLKQQILEDVESKEERQ